MQRFRVQNHWVAPRSTQPFIFLRSIKWVPGTPTEIVVKSRLSLHSGSAALRQFKSIHGNPWFSDYFRGNRSYLIRLNSRNIRSKVWRGSLIKHIAITKINYSMESLVDSHIDHWNDLFMDFPQYQINHLTKLKGACFGFVLSKYGNKEDTSRLKWLLSLQIILGILKSAFRGLINEDMPAKTYIQRTNLRLRIIN